MTCVENTKQAGYHSFLVQPPLFMTEKTQDAVRMGCQRELVLGIPSLLLQTASLCVDYETQVAEFL